MALFAAMMIVPAAAAGIYAYFFIRRILRFFGVGLKKKQFKMVNAALAAVVAALCVNPWTTRAMVILHVLFISIVLDAAALIFRRIYRNRQPGKYAAFVGNCYRSGILPVLITALVFVYGFFNMGHAVKTEYTVETDKDVADYKILMITDTHYGTIQDTQVLKDKIREMNEENPDIVILGGDIVEEETSKAKMQEVFALFGGMNNKYGIYYVYGNHDKQPYSSSRTYTDKELEEAVTNNGITILKDECAEINDDLVIAGRDDAAWGNVSDRASTKELLAFVDREKFILLADHQPVEAEENDAQGVDLEVSGHTHAGQIWPIGWMSELTGVLNYGEYQKGNCKVIVSSGFTGWGYPIRTEEHCEYVVINLKNDSDC